MTALADTQLGDVNGFFLFCTGDDEERVIKHKHVPKTISFCTRTQKLSLKIIA